MNEGLPRPDGRQHRIRNRVIAGGLSAAILVGGGYATARLANEAADAFTRAANENSSLVHPAGNGVKDVIEAGGLVLGTLATASVPPLTLYLRGDSRRERKERQRRREGG